MHLAELSPNLKNFIQEHQALVNNYQLYPLAQDASTRKYYRLNTAKQNFIIMDSSLDLKSLAAFIKVTSFLENHKFSVPHIFTQDLDNGFLLIEDLGDNSLNKILTHNPNKSTELYFLAIDNLIQIAQIKANITLPQHNETILLDGMKQFAEFYLNLKLAQKDFMLLCQNLLAQLNYKESYISLRDFHADNLMYLPDRKNFQKIGLLDYQDASLGFLSYDLLSLIQDARRYVTPKLQEKLLGYFLDHMPHINQEKFMLEYHILSFQRNSRIIGLFNKFHKIDHNPAYLKYLDNVMRYLQNNLEHSPLKEMKNFLKKSNGFL